MATDRPDPGDFLELAQRMLRELFGNSPGENDPWAAATRPARELHHEPSAEQRRENLTFALATRAVEALGTWRSTSPRSASVSSARTRRAKDDARTGTTRPGSDRDRIPARP
jgi:hypothetical protein